MLTRAEGPGLRRVFLNARVAALVLATSLAACASRVASNSTVAVPSHESDSQGNGDAYEEVAARMALCRKSLDERNLDGAYQNLVSAIELRNASRVQTYEWLARDPVGTSEECLRLSLAFEERQDLERALTAREAWDDVRSRCLNGMGLQEADRLTELARLRICLGESEEGLVDLECLVNSVKAVQRGPDFELAYAFGDSACSTLTYALAHHLTRPEEVGVERPISDSRGDTWLTRALETIDTASARNDPGLWIDAVPEPFVREMPMTWGDTARNAKIRLMAANLERCGDAARQELERRLQSGDARALLIAPWTHFFNLMSVVDDFSGSGVKADARVFAGEVLRFRQRFAEGSSRKR